MTIIRALRSLIIALLFHMTGASREPHGSVAFEPAWLRDDMRTETAAMATVYATVRVRRVSESGDVSGLRPCLETARHGRGRETRWMRARKVPCSSRDA